MSSNVDGEQARWMPRLVAVIVRHIAECERGNASRKDLAREKLSTLIHYPRGLQKMRADKPRIFCQLTLYCIRKQSRRHAEKRAPARELPRDSAPARV